MSGDGDVLELKVSIAAEVFIEAKVFHSVLKPCIAA